MEKGGEKARNFSKTHVWTRSVAGLLGQADKGSFSCRQLRVRHHSRQRTTPPPRERSGTRGDSCLGDRVPRAGTTSLLTRARLASPVAAASKSPNKHLAARFTSSQPLPAGRPLRDASEVVQVEGRGRTRPRWSHGRAGASSQGRAPKP
jgi:hypothetical protein